MQNGSLLAQPGSIQVFLTCARAGTAASVSRPVSHNEEEHSFDVFIHTAFVYVLTVSGRTHHVTRLRCGSLYQTQPRSMAQKAKQIVKSKSKVFLLSVLYEEIKCRAVFS